jgi:hypothetical protein
MELAAEVEASLREFATGGPVEVRENGGRLAPLSVLSWEIRGAGEKPLLHLWSDQYNLTRRILGITDHSEQRLALAVERFGRSKPDRIEFVRVEFERGARELSRAEFAERLRHILAAQFPDESLESLTTSADLEHTLSGSYARGVLRRGSSQAAFLAVAEGESADAVDSTLTFGLLWLDRLRHSNSRGTVSGLRLILPKKAGARVAHLLPAVDSSMRISIYELDTTRETLQLIDPGAVTNIDISIVPHRESEVLLARARPELESFVALAPQAITLHPSLASREVFLRFRGLPFARWHEGRVFFATSESREEVTPSNRPALKTLLHELEVHRHPLATDTRHPLHRARPERWLEAIVCQDITRVDPALDPRFVYPQVFANAGGEHGILDLLAVTRAGRLAILELKAAESVRLPLQAAGYWLRIRKHLEQGDFPRYSYFNGIQLQSAAPIVYLVAPALRFHPTTDTLLRYFSREIEVVRVGLAESWRRGFRVVLRQ